MDVFWTAPNALFYCQHDHLLVLQLANGYHWLNYYLIIIHASSAGLKFKSRAG